MNKHLRRTKIIATLGPSSNSKKNIEKLIEIGVDCFRLNFSHGSRDFHRECIKKIRETSHSKGRYCGILADLQGPKIRVGEIQDGKVHLKQGDSIILTSETVIGNAQRVSISYKELALDVRKGNQFLLDDGLLTFEVEQVNLSTQEIHCNVIYGGNLKSRKGINLPGVNLSARSLTAQDLENAFLSIEEWVDYIALSFVRKPEDIDFLKELIESQGKKRIPIIAKIERKEALDNIEGILQKADGLMIARGDLGVEMRLEKVPLIQKNLIRQCNLSTKLVITATQMLESMIQNPMPTRAEVSDVANAILDGTDAIMLSGETAVGNYPYEVVEQMIQIALEIEGSSTATSLYTRTSFYDEREYTEKTGTIEETMALSACRISKNLNVKVIFAYTHTGDSIRLLAKFHPVCPIIALCSSSKLAQEMQLVWGVIPFVRPIYKEPSSKKTTLSKKTSPKPELISDTTSENLEEWRSFLSSTFRENELNPNNLIVTTGNKKLASRDKINSVRTLHFSQFVL